MNVHTYIGEIRMFGGDFAPPGWALCDGRLLTISDNESLFVRIGTYFGGDGFETFGLPDMRGRVPVHPGNEAEALSIGFGQPMGAEQVTLRAANLPAHSHDMMASNASATVATPKDNFLAKPGVKSYVMSDKDNPGVTMNAKSIGATGDPACIAPTIQASLSVNFIIALDGQPY